MKLRAPTRQTNRLLPVVFPAVMQLQLFGLGYEDKAIWFGVLLLTVVNIGLISPPVAQRLRGRNAGARRAGRTYLSICRDLSGGLDALRLTLLVAAPIISLWLVQFVRQ